MKTTRPKGVKVVQAVEKALRILEALGNRASPLTLSEICETINLNMSTTYRLLQTLISKGFVHYDEFSGKYRLGIKTFRIGNAALYAIDFRAEARPLLQELVSLCKETANLVILDGNEVVYIEQVESRSMVRMLARLGSRLPAYSTGGGKAILAYLEEEELNEYLVRQNLVPHTVNTITSPTELKKALARIRQDGYAVDREEMEYGVRCVAAPIRNYTGKVIAALSVSGPGARMTDEYVEARLAPLVKQFADRISARLGYRG